MKLLLTAIVALGLVACTIVPTDKRTIELPTQKYRLTDEQLAAKQAIYKFKQACTQNGWLVIDDQRFICHPEAS